MKINRKFKEKLGYFLINPFFLATPFLVLALIFIPEFFHRYQAHFVSVNRADKDNSVVYFKDLNHDGNDDEISFFANIDRQAAVKVTLYKEKILNQFNMNGVFPSKTSGFFINVDNDSFTDVSMVYFRNDSAFLSVLQPIDTSRLYVDDIFIDHISDPKKLLNLEVTNQVTKDLNGDGSNEIAFSLNAGYPLFPRNLYVVDVKNNKVKKSPYLATITYPDPSGETFTDLDNDGKYEILLFTSSPGNISPDGSKKLHDHSSWMIILDENLDFWTEPIEFRGTPSGLLYRILDKDRGKKVIYYFVNGSASGDSGGLFLFDPATKKIIRSNINLPTEPLTLVHSPALNNTMTFYDRSGNFYQVNDQLELKKVKSLKDFPPSGYVATKDIDDDGQLEIVHTDNNFDGIYIFRHDYSNPVFLHIPIASGQSLKNVSFFELAGKQPMIIIHVDNLLYGYYYFENKLYWLKWIVIGAFYLLFAAFIYLVLHVQKNLLKRKYQKAQKLAELKLRSIRNQMDPHFTFNAVNAIGAAIFKEDRDTAYRYFTKFSKLIRSTMLYSDRLSRFLDDEVDFTRKYLDIEKFRFREKINFEINVGPDLDFRNEVPRMVVQSLAESAVNNGLMHRIEGGFLKIDISEKGDVIEIVVTDNGVGIERSKELNKEKAFKSIKIMEEFIAGINELNNNHITLEMFDLYESGQIAGTRVIVRVPYGIRYSAEPDTTDIPLRLFRP